MTQKVQIPSSWKSGLVPAEVLWHEKLSAVAKLLVGVVVTCMGDFPGIKALARACSCDPRQVQRAIKQLEIEKFLVRKARFEKGRQVTNEYIFKSKFNESLKSGGGDSVSGGGDSLSGGSDHTPPSEGDHQSQGGDSVSGESLTALKALNTPPPRSTGHPQNSPQLKEEEGGGQSHPSKSLDRANAHVKTRTKLPPVTAEEARVLIGKPFLEMAVKTHPLLTVPGKIFDGLVIAYHTITGSKEEAAQIVKDAIGYTFENREGSNFPPGLFFHAVKMKKKPQGILKPSSKTLSESDLGDVDWLGDSKEVLRKKHKAAIASGLGEFFKRIATSRGRGNDL